MMASTDELIILMQCLITTTYNFNFKIKIKTKINNFKSNKWIKASKLQTMKKWTLILRFELEHWILIK